MHFLEDVAKRCRKQKTRLILSGVHAQPTVAIARAGLMDELGEDSFAATVDQALNMARKHMGLPELDTASPTSAFAPVG